MSSLRPGRCHLSLGLVCDRDSINICQSKRFENVLLFWAIFACSFLYLYSNKFLDDIQECLGWRNSRGLNNFAKEMFFTWKEDWVKFIEILPHNFHLPKPCVYDSSVWAHKHEAILLLWWWYDDSEHLLRTYLYTRKMCPARCTNYPLIIIAIPWGTYPHYPYLIFGETGTLWYTKFICVAGTRTLIQLCPC